MTALYAFDVALALAAFVILGFLVHDLRAPGPGCVRRVWNRATGVGYGRHSS